MRYFATWPPAGESPLFRSAGLKRAGEYLTEEDLEAQYGFMTDEGERALRQQMQSMGRPLTRMEQQNLMKGPGSTMGEGVSGGAAWIRIALLLGLGYWLFKKIKKAEQTA